MRQRPSGGRKLVLGVRAVMGSYLLWFAVAAAPGAYVVWHYFNSKSAAVQTEQTGESTGTIDDKVNEVPKKLIKKEIGDTEYRYWDTDSEGISNNLWDATKFIKRQDNYGQCNINFLWEAAVKYRDDNGWYFVDKKSSHPDKVVQKYWQIYKP